MSSSRSSKRSPLKFFLLVFALSIPLFVVDAIIGKGLPLPVDLPLSSLMGFCPLTVALILVYREDKTNGLRKLLKRVFDYKRINKIIWYVPIIFLMPIIMVLSYWAMRLIGIPFPQPNIPFLWIPVFFVMYFIEAVGEEGGWMGYVVDLMQDRWTGLQTGVMLGSVWAIWHVVPYFQAHHTSIWIVWQCLFTIAARVLIVWLYNNTGRSVLAAILFHTMINLSWSLFPNYGSHYDPAVTGSIATATAIIVTFLWGAKTLSRYRYA